MTHEPSPVFRWLRPALLALACVVGVQATWRFFCASRTGQQLDTLAYFGADIGSWAVGERADHLLQSSVSVRAIAIGIAALVAVALLRRRWLLALEVATVVGLANITTQALKYHLYVRSVLVNTPGLNDNSFPSGHTTAAASLMVGALLVAPRRLRAPVAVLGSLVMMTFGWSTLAAHWHRPSDVVGGYLVCFGWANVALFVQAARQALLGRGRHEVAEAERPSRAVPLLLVLAGAFAFAVAGYGAHQVWGLWDVWHASHEHNFWAYLGASAGICGTATAGMGVLLRLVQLQDARAEQLV